MPALDIWTISLNIVLISMVGLIAMSLLWLQHRKRFSGLGLWVMDFLFQVIALSLIALRGIVPDWMSYVLSNTFVVAGTMLLYHGLEKFSGKKSIYYYNIVFLLLFASVQAFFTFYRPSLAARGINLSVGILLVSIQIIWLAMKRVDGHFRESTKTISIIFMLYAITSIARIIGTIYSDYATQDFFKAGLLEAFVIISYSLLLIFLAYSLMLMVNKRLLYDLQSQEERFIKAFQCSPYAILLTEKGNGRIIEANKGFTDITGYSYEEAIGKTTNELRLWITKEDREVFVSGLVKKGKVSGEEFSFRNKKGEIKKGIFSAEILRLNDMDCIIATIIDITEKKKSEEELEKTKKELEKTLEEFYTYRIGMEKNLSLSEVRKENRKIKKKMDSFKSKK